MAAGQDGSANSVVEKEVEAYLSVVSQRGELSSLGLVVKEHYQKYLQSRKVSILRSLAKEVRVLVRDTFSEKEQSNYREILGGSEECSDSIDLVLARGKILTNEEYCRVIALVDRSVSFGGACDFDGLNKMLAAYEASKDKRNQ